MDITIVAQGFELKLTAVIMEYYTKSIQELLVCAQAGDLSVTFELGCRYERAAIEILDTL